MTKEAKGNTDMADIDTTKIDFERAAMLLSLIEKQASVAPRATHLSGAAHAELMKINDAIKVVAIEAEKKARAEEAKQAQAKVLDEKAKRPDEPDPDPRLRRSLERSADISSQDRKDFAPRSVPAERVNADQAALRDTTDPDVADVRPNVYPSD